MCLVHTRVVSHSNLFHRGMDVRVRVSPHVPLQPSPASTFQLQYLPRHPRQHRANMGSSAHSHTRLIFRETDEADNPTVTYIYSDQKAQKSASSGGRLDVLVSHVPFSSCAFPRPDPRMNALGGSTLKTSTVKLSVLLSGTGSSSQLPHGCMDLMSGFLAQDQINAYDHFYILHYQLLILHKLS